MKKSIYVRKIHDFDANVGCCINRKACHATPQFLARVALVLIHVLLLYAAPQAFDEPVLVVLAVGISLEGVRAVLLQLLLPLVDLVRAELVLAAQLGQRLAFLHRFQGDLRRVLAAADFLSFVHLF